MTNPSIEACKCPDVSHIPIKHSRICSHCGLYRVPSTKDVLREIEQEAEKMRYSPVALDTSEASERVMNAVNETVDGFVSLIRSHMKE